MVKIYNTLTRKKEIFTPIEDKNIKMYACGITASGEAHLGHAYQSIIFDVINRYLKYYGYNVHYVRNYTDIDDKIIIKANRLNKHPVEYSVEVMEETNQLLLELGNANDIDIVKVSDNINEIINFIESLIQKKYAYEDGLGNVFFDVNKFAEYGKLSNINIEKNYIAVRKDIIGEKENSFDFALWKSAKPEEIYFDSPFGKGRPGWHIECSAMARRYLGDQLDIHGGGRDLIFPHHENEIAQTEALTGKKFTNYWIHNGLVKINGEKMSKSLGNGITIKEALLKYNKEVIRYTLLQTSYNSDINIVDGIFEIGEAKLYYYYQTFEKIQNKEFTNSNLSLTNEYIDKIIYSFEEAMNNNFNTSLVIANLAEIFNFLNLELNKNDYNLLLIKDIILKLYNILGLFTLSSKEFINYIKNKYLAIYKIDEKYITDKINERNDLKKKKSFNEADEIRNNLLRKGIVLNDTRHGTLWDIKIG